MATSNSLTLAKLADARQLLNEKLAQALLLLTKPDWKITGIREKITSSSHTLPNSHFHAFRFETFIAAPPIHACDAIWDCHPVLGKYDPTLQTFRVLEQIDVNTRVCHQQIQPNAFLTRDILYIQTRLSVNEKYYIITSSLDPKLYSALAVGRDPVYATVKFSVFIFSAAVEAGIQGTQLVNILHIEPGGWIAPITANNHDNSTVRAMINFCRIRCQLPAN